MLREAVDHYHSLLNDRAAAETDGMMRETLRRRSLYFGARPICTVLRPHFYIKADWEFVTRETEVLLSAFARAHEACMEQDSLRAQLMLQDYEEHLFALDRRGVIPWTTSRLDSFFLAEQGTLRYVEYNAETPAGMGYEDVLAQTFLELPVFRRFQERYHVRHMPLLGELLNALLWGYRHWGGKHKPQIAIVDWQDVPTLNEHEMCRIHFERSGIRTVLADPRALEYRSGALWVGNFRIDMIYKRVLWSELVKQMGVENPIIRAIADHAVYMTNSISCKLMAKKASFAFLSDERNSHLFTPQQQIAIGNHIPWTRIVSERKTHYEGQEVELIPFITEHRDQFVLKPNDEYGGKGVVIGWECSDAEWAASIRESHTTPYVVQKRVDSVSRLFPAWIDNSLNVSPRFVDADPYVFYGRTVYGCLTRLSSETLLNVTAGGGSVVPSFVIEKKS
jgi:glutathionylspermidine synthase